MSSVADELDALRVRFETETTRLGQLVLDLSNEVQGGISSTKAAAIRDDYKLIADRLTAIGKKPEDPIPPVEELNFASKKTK